MCVIRSRTRFTVEGYHRAPPWAVGTLSLLSLSAICAMLRPSRRRLSMRLVVWPDLSDKFQAVKDANCAYRNAIFDFMLTKDSGPRTDHEEGLLSVPREWAEDQKREAHDALADARSGLVRALRELFAMMHDFR